MQFLNITRDLMLQDFANIVGPQNVDIVLNANNLQRTPRIGKAYWDMIDDITTNMSSYSRVPQQTKITKLNKFTQDSDIFEKASLMSEAGWVIYDTLNTFSAYMYIPETVVIPDAADVLGNGIPVTTAIYNAVMEQLSVSPYLVDPSIFNEYSNILHSQISDAGSSRDLLHYWFKIPQGEVTLYSAIAGTSIDIPVYPEEVSDGTTANYTTMPEIIYQYEPWLMYESSGPRSNTYTFHLHRDLWSGDHNDGKANELVRFCQACCYPEYTGSVVHSDIVSLYISGNLLISGKMTDFTIDWKGPLGDDGWYLEFEMKFTITEVSPQALSHSVVRNKPLIG